MTRRDSQPGAAAPADPASPAPVADLPLDRIVVDTSGFRTSASLTMLHAWDRWRGARLLPARRDMNLADITALLPTVVVLELAAPEVATIRLAGTLLCTVFGRELRGLNWLELTPPEQRAARAARLHAVAHQPCGALTAGRPLARSGMGFEIEMLGLPVRPDDAAAPMQVLAVISRMPGQARPTHMADSELGRMPDQFSYVDIGAGLPPDA